MNNTCCIICLTLRHAQLHMATNVNPVSNYWMVFLKVVFSVLNSSFSTPLYSVAYTCVIITNLLMTLSSSSNFLLVALSPGFDVQLIRCVLGTERKCISGADPGIYFGGGQTKVPNRNLRAKPDSRARSARVSRAKPESRARSARELRAKPEPRAKPEKKRGEGSGERARWAPPQKIFKKITLETIHFGAYLKQLFEMTNEMV